MFFKKPRFSESADANRLREFADQLDRVKAFRNEIEREFKFHEFDDTDSWRERFRTWLTGHVLQQMRLEASRAVQPAQLETIQSNQISSDPGTVSSTDERRDDAIAQLEQLLDRVRGALQKKGPEFGEAFDVVLAADESARLVLLAMACMSPHSPSTHLSAHEMNLLYAHRKSVFPVQLESILLFRSLLADEHNIVSGWYWFEANPTPAIVELLQYFATEDNNDGIRLNALKLLGLIHDVSPAAHPHEVYMRDLRRALSDSSDGPRSFGLEQIGELGNQGDLGVVERVFRSTDPAMRGAALRARLRILLRTDMTAAIKELNGIEASELSYYLDYSKLFDRVPESQINCAVAPIELMLAHSDSHVREFALAAVLKRRGLSESEIDQLRRDRSPRVRAEACRWMIKSNRIRGIDDLNRWFEGAEPTVPSSLLGGGQMDYEMTEALDRLFVRSLPIEEVEKLARSFDLIGSTAYEELALRDFARASPDVRESIQCEFRNLADPWAAQARAASQAGKFEAARYDRAVGFLRRRYLVAAVRALREHLCPQDAPVLRSLLKHDDRDLQLAAVRALAEVGSSSDVDELIRIAGACHGKLRLASIDAALRLTTDSFAIAEKLITESDAELRRIGATALYSANSLRAGVRLEGLLGDADATVRLTALSCLVRGRTRPDVEELLDRYVARSSYYFNVTSRLDGVLYAPDAIRNRVEADLLKYSEELRVHQQLNS